MRRALKPVFAVLCLALSACGLEPSEEGQLRDQQPLPSKTQPQTEPTSVASPVVSPVRAELGDSEPHQAQRSAQSLLAPADDGLEAVSLVGALTAADGIKASMAVAMMGCGYWIAGTAETTVTSNHVSATVEDVLPAESYGATLFVFVDHDADGICDAAKGDGIFEASVDAGGTTVDAATLASVDGWYCMFFNDYGH